MTRKATRPIYKEIPINKSTNLTIRELTDNWQPIINYYELTPEQQQEANQRYEEFYAPELLYIIAEDTLYTLSDFIRTPATNEPNWRNEFDGTADDTNTSSILIKINSTGEAARLFIAY